MPMIVHDVAQQSDEWFALKLGLPSASRFDSIITPTGKESSQAEAYQNELIAEWLTGRTGGIEQNAWMARGNELEPEARAWYEFEHDTETQQVGIITDDRQTVGASPDSMVGDAGLVEIKCPAPHTHVSYLLSQELPGKYRPQVQGQMMIAERDWCDWVSYHPEIEPVVIRVYRDEEYIEKLRTLLSKFVEGLELKKEQLTERGIAPKQAEAA